MSAEPAPSSPSRPAGVPIPDAAHARSIVPAPGDGIGYWAGAPSAALDGDGFFLAYRVRRPIGQGRGVAVVLARYDDVNGVVPVAEVERELLGAESLERPALVRRPDGGWRVYVSCATPGSKHWWVEALDADSVEKLPLGTRTVVFPGDEHLGVKDPVVLHDTDGWHAWVCCHPLDDAGHEDRMWTSYAHSQDGLVWSDLVPVLRPRDGSWEQRGARVTAVLRVPDAGGPLVAYFDGRASAEQNWYERTGLASAPSLGSPLTLIGDEPVSSSPHGTHALRYLCVVPLDDGGHQLFFEASRPDGAHDLMTQTVSPTRQDTGPTTWTAGQPLAPRS